MPYTSTKVDTPVEAVEVSAYGGFLVVQQAARRMIPRGRGAILLTGASASVKGYPLSAAFAMGKFALRGLAQSTARELGPKGIHVAHFVIDGGVRSARRPDPPEGDLAAYERSLHRMVELRPEVIFPGHGPIVRPALAKLVEYLEHRDERERQVLRALRDGPQRPEEIVPAIYVEYPEALHAAAARSVLAHLIKLERAGVVARVAPSSDRFELTDRGSRNDAPT